MTVQDTRENQTRPRIGIPWRTKDEEDIALSTGEGGKTQDYKQAVENAGGEGVLLSLHQSEERERIISSLDAFVLPGSPADVDPETYNNVDEAKCAKPDKAREETDRAILSHAFKRKKPVLAICYGCQLLNVYQGGTLIRDIWSTIEAPLRHRKKDPLASNPENTPAGDPLHGAALEPGSRLAELVGATLAKINSSHHQAIEKPGKSLRVTAHAPDGVIEAVEWTGDSNWVVGVQWHPERMRGDRFAEKLFEDFVAAAHAARAAVGAKP